MKQWENYIYGFSGAALSALGFLFIILGLGCLFMSFAAFFLAFKKRTGFKLF